MGPEPRSGTLDAWFVETFKATAPNVDLQPALAKAQSSNALGLAIGAILGGVLPDVFGPIAPHHGFSIYDISYLASFAVMLGVFGFTMFAIVEEPRAVRSGAFRQGFANVPSVIKDAGLLALKHPTLSLLLAALALFLMATNPVEVVWPTHVKPMLNEGYANTLIGALTATYFFCIALGAFLSPYLNRFFKRRYAITLAVSFACLAGLQVVLALQENALGFVGIFIVYSVFLGVAETPASSILHRCVDDRQRSTMLSLRSLIQQLGAAFGLIFAGSLAEIYTTPTAWIACAAFLFFAAILTLVLAKQHAAATA